MVKISVISIAKDDEELKNLKYSLLKQNFKDFEFVYSTKGTIPEAWNDAISRAKGEFFVFTESDARPLQDTWLDEITKYLKKDVVIKGLEINPTSMDMCNLVCDRRIFDNLSFNEDFPIAEDMELFARLRKANVPIEQVYGFPVIHVQRCSWKKTLTRSFLLGRLIMKIIYLHGIENIDSTNTQNIEKEYINPISNRIRIIVDNLLFLSGLFIGLIIYSPMKFRR